MKKLVIIGNRIPEPNTTAAGSRMMQLIKLFINYECNITFLSANPENENSENLEKLNVTVFFIHANDNAFDKLILELDPNIVIFDRFYTEEQFGWRISKFCPNSIKILDTEDLHFLRFAREKCYLEQREIEFKDYINEVFVREIASIYRCDLSLIISEFEMEFLKNNFSIPNQILHYLPFIVDSVKDIKLNSFENRQNFISIGNFLHQPNWHTVLELKKNWKYIKQKLPEAKLEIYGAYLPQKAQELNNIKEGFLIKGKAESVSLVMENARVLLAPIPYGAGLKGKLLESMLYGLPNITTSIGAEGMSYNNLWNGYITNNTNEFAEKAISLYQNKNKWEEFQINGRLIIENKFLISIFLQDFFSKINHILENISLLRTQNYMGVVMQQNTIQASKYLSKWIMLKNQMNE